LDSDYKKLKSRKEEAGSRDDAVDSARRKLTKIQDSLDELKDKKQWITEE
jgi:hypothetical protein